MESVTCHLTHHIHGISFPHTDTKVVLGEETIGLTSCILKLEVSFFMIISLAILRCYDKINVASLELDA